MHNKKHVHPPLLTNTMNNTDMMCQANSLGKFCPLFLWPDQIGIANFQHFNLQSPSQEAHINVLHYKYRSKTQNTLCIPCNLSFTLSHTPFSLSPHHSIPSLLISFSVPLTSRLLASFRRYLVKKWQSMFAQQQATWTSGPSFPRLSPEETASTSVMVFMIRVHFPRYPRMMKPLRMVLICKNIRGYF